MNNIPNKRLKKKLKVLKFHDNFMFFESFHKSNQFNEAKSQ